MALTRPVVIEKALMEVVAKFVASKAESIVQENAKKTKRQKAARRGTKPNSNEGVTGDVAEAEMTQRCDRWALNRCAFSALLPALL